MLRVDSSYRSEMFTYTTSPWFYCSSYQLSIRPFHPLIQTSTSTLSNSRIIFYYLICLTLTQRKISNQSNIWHYIFPRSNPHCSHWSQLTFSINFTSDSLLSNSSKLHMFSLIIVKHTITLQVKSLSSLMSKISDDLTFLSSECVILSLIIFRTIRELWFNIHKSHSL